MYYANSSKKNRGHTNIGVKVVEAEVKEIRGRTGQYGECQKVLVVFTDPHTGRKRSAGRIVRGPLRVGDIIVLKDPNREVKI